MSQSVAAECGFLSSLKDKEDNHRSLEYISKYKRFENKDLTAKKDNIVQPMNPPNFNVASNKEC